MAKTATGQATEARVLAMTLQGASADVIASAVGLSVSRIEKIKAGADFKAAVLREGRSAVEDARAALRDAAGIAVEALVSVATASQSDSARVAAAREILARVGVTEEAAIKITGDLAHRSDAELAAMARQIAQALGPGDGDTDA